MNQYNPLIHHRKSIRLKGYDYSKAGLYFITICCQNRACLFGNVVVGANPCGHPNTDNFLFHKRHSADSSNCVVFI